MLCCLCWGSSWILIGSGAYADQRNPIKFLRLWLHSLISGCQHNKSRGEVEEEEDEIWVAWAKTCIVAEMGVF